MRHFKVPVVWSMMGYLQVEADSPEEAMQKAKEMVRDCPLPYGEYLDDSFEVDEEGDPLEIVDVAPEEDSDANQNNTCIGYLYRDASNYKQWNEAVVSGAITAEQIETIMSCLPDGENFIPSDVGLPETRFETFTEDDMEWFELSKEGFSATHKEPTTDLSVEDLVNAFLAKKEEWAKKIF